MAFSTEYVTTMCAFCSAPASSHCSDNIDLVTIKFLFHYFQTPVKFQVDLNEVLTTPTFPTCPECYYLFKEVRRLASIWVEVQDHLFENVVPEIQRRFEVKDVQQQLRTVDQDLRESPLTLMLKEEIMKLVGSIPDAVDAKRQANRLGRFGPVKVAKLAESDPKITIVSLPEIQIESEEWIDRHSSNEHLINVVTLVYNHDSVTSSSTVQILNSPLVTTVSNNLYRKSQEMETDGDDSEQLNFDDRVISPEYDYDSDEESFAKKTRFSLRKSPIEQSGENMKPGHHTETEISGGSGSPKKKKSGTSRKLSTEPRKQIQCKFCPLVVYYPHTYRKHEQRIHQNLLNHKCSKCKEIFSSEQFLLAHVEIHRTNVKEWICQICNLSCSRPHRLRKHIQDVHIPDFIEGSSVVKNNHALSTVEDMKCPVCSSQFTSRKKFTKHMNIHYKQVHPCEFCITEDSAFKTKEPQLMVAHLFKTHPDEPKNLSCSQCGKLFSYPFVLNRHIEYHKLDGLKPLSCMFCELRFSAEEELAFGKHQSTCIDLSESDNKLPDEKCSLCDKMFPRGRDILLARHERSHSELLINNCTDCEQKFTRKSFLDAHLVTHSIGPFQCTICPCIFDYSIELNQHLGEAHTGESMIKCKEAGCNEVFAHRSTMLYHRSKFHGGPKFVCKICNKDFNKRDGMKIHMERVHPKECDVPPRQFQCQICNKSFVRRTILIQHIRVAHEKKRIRKQTCKICQKEVSVRIFKQHLMHHQGIKPHLCSLCGKTFTWSNNYRIHLQMHSGVKNHKCEDCPKTFLNVSHLKHHSLTQHPRDEDGNLVPKPPRKNQAQVPRNRGKIRDELVKKSNKEEDTSRLEDTIEKDRKLLLGDEKEPEQSDVSDKDGDNHSELSNDEAISNLLLSHAKRSSRISSIMRKKSKDTSKVELNTSTNEHSKQFKPRVVSVKSLRGQRSPTLLENIGTSNSKSSIHKNTRMSTRNRKSTMKDDSIYISP